MTTYKVPFVIAGELKEDYAVEHPARYGGGASFVTPGIGTGGVGTGPKAIVSGESFSSEAMISCQVIS